jgi:hypothetical protein
MRWFDLEPIRPSSKESGVSPHCKAASLSRGWHCESRSLNNEEESMKNYPGGIGCATVVAAFIFSQLGGAGCARPDPGAAADGTVTNTTVVVPGTYPQALPGSPGYVGSQPLATVPVTPVLSGGVPQSAPGFGGAVPNSSPATTPAPAPQGTPPLVPPGTPPITPPGTPPLVPPLTPPITPPGTPPLIPPGTPPLP